MLEVKSANPRPAAIGEFEIVRKIGEGGLAEIYLARQKSLNRDIAIKVLHPRITQDEEIVKRFERESITLARMSHPNIVHVIDRGEDNGRLYFAMQYVAGTNFREVLSNAGWSVERKLAIIIQVLKGLDYAHKNGVIHRDIKPANILIDPEENALVADFGIAQLLEKESAERTESGVIMGTYAYMSPEQKIDSTLVDHTTDIYAMGIMLYEVLTGKKPVGRYQLPSEVNAQLPKGYDDIVVKALADSPVDRYQKAVEMKDELLALMHKNDKVASETAAPAGKVKNFIGNCSFLDTLKDGMFCSTYLVEDRASRGLYVIKKQSKPDVGLREAKLLANLRHPNILPIHGAGSDGTKLVVVMDYAQGGSLADRLVKPFHWRDARKLMIQIVEGMDFAHKNNIIHGNLKPSNILFDRQEVVKLSDFSLLANTDKNIPNWYAAPERRKSKAADIYAAGIIFYQLLTNRIPAFDTHGKFMWIDSNRTTPQAWRNLIEKMIRILPSERYQTFTEIQEVLQKSEDSAPTAHTMIAAAGLDAATKRLVFWGTAFVLTLILAVLILSGALGI
jgi:serine/threonine-protein kinase